MWPPDYLNCEERLQSGTSLLQFNSLGPIKIDVKVTKKDLEIMVVDYHKRNELLLFVRVCQYQNQNLTGSEATSRRRLHPNAERTHFGPSFRRLNTQSETESLVGHYSSGGDGLSVSYKVVDVFIMQLFINAHARPDTRTNLAFYWHTSLTKVGYLFYIFRIPHD